MLMFVCMFMAGAFSAATMILLSSLGIIKPYSPAPLVILPLVINIVIAMLIASIVSNSYIKPIRRLINATKEIAKGNFDVHIDVKKDADSEFAELERSFNSMAQELGSIELFRTSFINDFSHEFKTPIVSIRGFANQLKNDDLDEETRNGYVDIIIAEADRLTNLSSNVLLLSKLENQTIITDKKDFMLDEQIRQCILLLEKQWCARDIALAIDLDGIKVHTNFDLTSQIWINLLSNSIKFSAQGGEISVRAYTEEERAVVEIQDRGIGMTEEQLSHIFDKFYQGDASRKAEGSGLGMSIVGRIIDILNGRIEIKSSPGEGTLFVIKLDIIANN